jgi:hypothetical protein
MIEDEASGKPLYVQDDGTTAWERHNEIDSTPTKLHAETASSHAASEISEEVKEVAAESLGTLLSKETPPEWTEPINSVTYDEATEKIDSSGSLRRADNDADNKPTDTLPDGWVELLHADSRQRYYFNEDLNETSWARPVASGSSHQDDEPARAATQIDDTLHDGWEEIIDPSTGDTYFYNATTGESAWDRPLSKSLGQEASMNYRDKSSRPQAIATFGFGGRLCVVRHVDKVSPVVLILRTGTVVKHDPALIVEKAKMDANFSGPLTAGTEAKVLSYVSRKADVGSPNEMLWRLIVIASEYNGRLRSDLPKGDPRSPESAVARLLTGCVNEHGTNGNLRLASRSNSGERGTQYTTLSWRLAES